MLVFGALQSSAVVRAIIHLRYFRHNDIYLFMVPVTVNGAEVGRMPQSQLSIKALLVLIKGKVKNNQEYSK